MPTGVYQHKPRSEATRKKISEAHKKLGTRPPNITKGVKPPHFKEMQEKAWEANRLLVWDRSPRWKGSEASYDAKHKRMHLHYGKATRCEFCKRKGLKSYQWANLSGEHKPVRSDWIHLCAQCHTRFDSPAWLRENDEWRKKCGSCGVFKPLSEYRLKAPMKMRSGNFVTTYQPKCNSCYKYRWKK